jgi:hypothetical protein
MTKLSIEEQDHEFEGASRPRSSFGVRRCSAAFEKPSQIENRCSPAMVQSIYKFKTDALSVTDDFVPIVD